MKKEIKETILRTLHRRKDILTHKGNRNVQFMEEQVKEWKSQLESNQKYAHHSAGGLGVRMEINAESNKKYIKEFEERLKRSYKEIAELEQAIEYMESE